MIEPFAGNPNAVKQVADTLGGALKEAGKLADKAFSGRGAGRAQLEAVRDAIAHDAKMQREARQYGSEQVDKILEYQGGQNAEDRAQQENEHNRFVTHAVDLLGSVQPGTEMEFSHGSGSFRGTARTAAASAPTDMPPTRHPIWHPEHPANRIVSRAVDAGLSISGAERVTPPAEAAQSPSPRMQAAAAAVARNRAGETSPKTKVMPVVKPAGKDKKKTVSDDTEVMNIGGIKPAEALED
jgi:hypothetical protein